MVGLIENDQISYKSNHYNKGDVNIIDIIEKSVIFLSIHPK